MRFFPFIKEMIGYNKCPNFDTVTSLSRLNNQDIICSIFVVGLSVPCYSSILLSYFKFIVLLCNKIRGKNDKMGAQKCVLLIRN